MGARTAYHRDYYLKNRERILKRSAEREAKHLRKPEHTRAKSLRYYYKNRAKVRAAQKKYNDEHRAENYARHRKYIKERPIQARAYGREYAKRNRDKWNAEMRKRRSREKGSGGAHTAKQWQDLVRLYDHRCLRCGKQEPEITLHGDHVLPISRGGSSDISNIQPLCARCNKSKGPKHVDYRQSAQSSAVRKISCLASAYHPGPAEELNSTFPLTADRASL